MIEIAVKYLQPVTGATPVTGNAERICRGVAIDSREVQKDAIFVAFPGEKVDGNSFTSKALEAGAAACILTREPTKDEVKLADEQGAALFTCEDPEQFLLDLAQGYRARLGAIVVGITGSIGKTTTKDVLTTVLSTRFKVHATKGNYNSVIGMPLTILAAPRDAQVLVLEMGMNHAGEIERMSTCAQPQYAVITKIGTSHIGLLGGRENIARAKAEILAGMHATAENFEGQHSCIFLNGEDDFTPFITKEFAKPKGVDVVLCGTSDDDDVSARNIQIGADGCPSFDITYTDGANFKASLSIPGAQAVPNALFACALAERLGIARFEIDQALKNLKVTGHRQEIKRAACGAQVIDDSYNASPESTAAGLDLLCKLNCTGSRIAILGEMGELGSEEKRLHELTGAYAAAKKLDLLVCVGAENAQAMAAAARMFGMSESSVAVAPSCEAALKRYGRALGAADAVLVKGSRFVGLDKFVEGVC